MPENNFEKILLSAVEEGFSSLGDSSKQAIFFRLETSHQVNKEKIPANLTEFKHALEGIFGPEAQYLEKTITRRLHEKLGLKFEEGEWTDFLGCVKATEKRTEPRKDRSKEMRLRSPETLSERKQLKQELNSLHLFSDGLDEIVYVTDPCTHEVFHRSRRKEKKEVK